MERTWYQIRNEKGSKKAEILIYEQIGKSWFDDSGIEAKKFVQDLRKLDVKVIDLRINSPGGNLFDGNAIYNALRSHSATINVFIDGVAASIASVIAMSGNTIEMPENAMMMIHDPQGMVMGTAADMMKVADVLDKMKVGIVAAYRDKTEMDDADIAELMTDETWMTAEEAVKWGFADKMTERVDIQNNFQANAFSNFRNTPTHIVDTFINGIPARQSKAGTTIRKKEKEIMGKNLDTKPPEVTLDLIRSDYTDIATALTDEGRTEGAKAETERIKAVFAHMTPGHEKLVHDLMLDGKTTGPEAAGLVLAALRKSMDDTSKNLDLDAPPPVNQPANDGLGDPPDTSAPLEARCKAKWDKGAALRAEFMDDFDVYLAAEKAIEAGNVRIISSKE